MSSPPPAFLLTWNRRLEICFYQPENITILDNNLDESTKILLAIVTESSIFETHHFQNKMHSISRYSCTRPKFLLWQLWRCLVFYNMSWLIRWNASLNGTEQHNGVLIAHILTWMYQERELLKGKKITMLHKLDKWKTTPASDKSWWLPGMLSSSSLLSSSPEANGYTYCYVSTIVQRRIIRFKKKVIFLPRWQIVA